MNTITQCRPALGTYVEISISAPISDDELLDLNLSAFEEINRIESLMSFHDPNSELSQLNKNAHLEPFPISQDMESVLCCALELSHRTKGLYDISITPELIRRGHLPDPGHICNNNATWQDISIKNQAISFNYPMQLHLGGIAKGYAVDRALAFFDKDTDATVNAGGDLRMTQWSGKKANIKAPGNKKANHLVEIDMLAPALATSASYYLGNEAVIISPGSSTPIQDRGSISVFSTNCMLADALTKVVFLQPDCKQLLKSLNSQAVIIDQGGAVSKF